MCYQRTNFVAYPATIKQQNRRFLLYSALLITMLVVILTTNAEAAVFSIAQNGDNIEIVTISSPAAPSPLPEIPGDPAPSGLDYSTWTVGNLSRHYMETWRRNEKKAILQAIGGKKPASFRDLRWLLNLYSRSETEARFYAKRSLRRLGPRDKRFEPLFAGILRDQDPFLRMFGLIGAFQIESEEARPAILEIARKRFSHPQPMLLMIPEDANNWNLQFYALRILAMRQDPEAFALLVKRSKEAPPVASLMARFYWERSLPKFVKWTESRSKRNRERSWAAWHTDVPLEELRKTRGELREIVFSKRRKMESRHQAALRLGISANPAEVGRLLEERLEAKDKKLHLLLTTALFASRDERVIPILLDYAKTHKSALTRAGTAVQLRTMLPKDAYRELLQWVSNNDPDGQNRQNALRELANPD